MNMSEHPNENKVWDWRPPTVNSMSRKDAFKMHLALMIRHHAEELPPETLKEVMDRVAPKREKIKLNHVDFAERERRRRRKAEIFLQKMNVGKKVQQTTFEAAQESISPEEFSFVDFRWSVPLITRLVCAKRKLPYESVTGAKRTPALVRARREIWYWTMRTMPWVSLNQIARSFGSRDHTTVLYGVDKFCEEKGVPFPRKRGKGTKATTRIAWFRINGNRPNGKRSQRGSRTKEGVII